jgi:phosphoenolpyruvate-protein phosphotransferase
MSSPATDLPTVARTPAGPDLPHQVLIGRPGSPGIGVGRVLVVESIGASSLEGPGAQADPTTEAARLSAALEAAATELTALAEQTTLRAGEDVGAIFVAQALFARDPGIVGPALAEVAYGAPAAESILSVTGRHADSLGAVDDDYFRERAADVRDVGRRVAAIVRGDHRPDLWHRDGRPAVVVAVDLDPSAVATLRPELVRGIALAGGTSTGHAAIVARALGIPLVLGLGDAIASLATDAEVAVDGTNGRVITDPTPEQLAGLDAASTTSTSIANRDPSRVHGIAVTANVSSALEAAAAATAGADGIGLVRTELVFLGRHAPPTIDEQRATYARIRAALGPGPIVFRTLDVGGDKPASWGGGLPEANPALGVRGVRLGLTQPALLDDQLRALVEASSGAELRVMLPMVATVEEVVVVRTRLEAILASVESTPSAVLLGVMIEVPAAALLADGLAEVADFFSIGTNDLVQYTLAADRVNPAMADLATPLQPAVLRLIAGVVTAARDRGRHVAVCGEAAGDPSVIPLLIGLGVEELSVTPGAIGRVRDVLAGLDPGACKALAGRALEAHTLAEVKALLEAPGE